jgi:hypothetical protein
MALPSYTFRGYGSGHWGRSTFRRRGKTLEPTRRQSSRIGFGTSSTAPHYPLQVTKLTGVDERRALASRVAKNFPGSDAGRS